MRAEKIHRPLFADYRAFYGIPSGFRLHPNWLKLFWLHRLMTECSLGTVLLYLDTDTRVRRAFDPAALLPPPAEFAAVRNVWGQYNVGVTAWVVTERTRRQIAAAWADGPSLHQPAEDQPVINRYLQGCCCRELGSEWNSYRAAKGGMHHDPWIESWHGESIEYARCRLEAG